MQNIWKRFSYYGIGFAIGLIFVIFFFQNRGCAWLPANRVKNTILDKVLVVPEDEWQRMQAIGLNKDDVLSFLNDGKVLFKSSLKDMNVYPKVYVFEKKKHNDNIRLQFSLYDDSFIALVHHLANDSEAQRFEQLEGYGVFLRVPRDSALVFVDPSKYTQCKASGLDFPDKENIEKQLVRTGSINLSKSNLMLPKAEHHLLYEEVGGRKVEGKAIWFESRITFKDFFWDEALPCEESFSNL
jgi:hypothetical protein